MIDYRFYSFTDNLLVSIAGDFQMNNTLFIHPTEASKKKAEELSQEKNPLSNTLFLTMEEFKEYIFLAKLPVLKEDKRVIALYNAISTFPKNKLNEMRNSFKFITKGGAIDFFQFVGFATDFFNLLEEMNEERKQFVTIIANPDFDLGDWQITLYDYLKEIRKAYQTYLNKKEYADKIFLYLPDNADSCYFREYESIVFVNQHYYTPLEKQLIYKFSDAEKKITICFQLPQKDNSPQTFDAVKDFSIDSNTEIKTNQLSIHKSNSDFSMICHLFPLIKEKTAIIDKNFSSSSYYSYLSPAIFSHHNSGSITQTPLYSFFQTLIELLESIVNEKKENRQLLPLTKLLTLYENSIFNVTDEIRKEVISLINKQLENNTIYLDLHKPNFTVNTSLLNNLLKQLEEIKTIKEMAEYFSKTKVLNFNIISENSNLLDIYFQTLANLTSLEDLFLIEDNFLPPNGIKRISFLLRLLLENLKAKKIRYAGTEGKVAVGSLLDTRNFSYDELIFLNVTEGIFPPSASTPFLFSESQRKKLGLKTYEDIRNWEKYYFYRLVLTAKTVHLICQENDESVISSFAEELQVCFPDITTIQERKIFDYGVVYRQIYPQSSGFKPTAQEKLKDQDFYTIPFELEKDFPDKSIYLSASSYNDLQDSPFCFYLKNIARIGDIDEKDLGKISPAVIGTIAHQILQMVWDKYKKLNQPLDKEYLYALLSTIKLDVVLGKDNLYYNIPHNHSGKYFEKIVWDNIITGIKAMFEWLAETLGEDNLVRVDAELRFNSKKQNCLLYDKYADYNVYLKGIADLLLDTNKQRLVIDYKTAKLDSYKSEQLIFYELLTSSSIPHTRNGKLSSSIPHACNENLSTSIPLACKENLFSSIPLACKGELKGVEDNITPPKIENYPHTCNGNFSSSIPHACNENLSTSIPLACKGELKGVADNNTPPKIENPFTESLYFSLLVENEKKSLSYMNKKKSRTEIYEEFRDKLHNLLADVFDTGFTYSKKNNKYYSDILRSDLKKKHIKSQSI